MRTIGGSIVSTITTILSLILIVAGLLFVYFTQQARALTIQPLVATTVTDSVSRGLATPANLSIPTLNIQLDVKLGIFNRTEGQWEVNDSDAFYAQGTTTPILYAHNRNGIFSNLRNASEGDVLTLNYRDGTTEDYYYSNTRIIPADDPSVLTESNETTVILLTCEGLFSESRRLTYFTKVSS